MNSLSKPVDLLVNQKAGLKSEWTPVLFKALKEIQLVKKDTENQKIAQLKFLICLEIMGSEGYLSVDQIRATNEQAKMIGLSGTPTADKIGQKIINNCQEYTQQEVVNLPQKPYQTQVDLIAEFYKNNAQQLFPLEKTPSLAEYFTKRLLPATTSPSIPKSPPKLTNKKQDKTPSSHQKLTWGQIGLLSIPILVIFGRILAPIFNGKIAEIKEQARLTKISTIKDNFNANLREVERFPENAALAATGISILNEWHALTINDHWERKDEADAAVEHFCLASGVKNCESALAKRNALGYPKAELGVGYIGVYPRPFSASPFWALSNKYTKDQNCEGLLDVLESPYALQLWGVSGDAAKTCNTPDNQKVFSDFLTKHSITVAEPQSLESITNALVANHAKRYKEYEKTEPLPPKVKKSQTEETLTQQTNNLNAKLNTLGDSQKGSDTQIKKLKADVEENVKKLKVDLKEDLEKLARLSKTF